MQESVQDKIIKSDSHTGYQILNVLIRTLNEVHEHRIILQTILEEKVQDELGSLLDTQGSLVGYNRIYILECLASAQSKGFALDLTEVADVLLGYYERHPLHDAALRSIQQLLISQLTMEFPERVIHMLFKTNLCRTLTKSCRDQIRNSSQGNILSDHSVSTSGMVHLANLGQHLVELQESEPEVDDFLEEMVENWGKFVTQLGSYQDQ